jgi:Trypsin-like peptidase domain
MDYSRILANRRVKEELLDRFNELAAFTDAAGGQLESVRAHTKDDAVAATESLVNGGPMGELEAIILRFTRPVLLIQDGQFSPPSDQFPNAKEIQAALDAARAPLETAIKSVGRVDLRNHSMSWVGTGWRIRDDVVVTNRHVAESFARSTGAGFDFRVNPFGKKIGVSIDWFHEHNRATESIFRVKEVLWIEPDGNPDLALLRVETTNIDGHPLPAPLELATAGELKASFEEQTWVAVIGYPAQDSRNDSADQQRIFDGVYNIKRLAPGQLTALRNDGLGNHDSTTLGGNSGSAVIDVRTGKVAALHFGGIEGDANFCVQAPELARIIQQRL